jgi:uracil-DNA glycosylase
MQRPFSEASANNPQMPLFSGPSTCSQPACVQPATSETLDWKAVLGEERAQPYFQEILKFIEAERIAGRRIYPANADIFNCLKFTPFDQVKAVIIGQDPYHGPGQAHGLSFSVKQGVPTPPSLQNIFKELQADLGLEIPKHGCLEQWACQGVLLLNASLSVEESKPMSHAKLGWQRFTDRIISELNSRRSGIVFMLWGRPAREKCAVIDRARHHVLTAPHPSPLSAHGGFFGCKHFSQCNALLKAQGLAEIDWRLQ